MASFIIASHLCKLLNLCKAKGIYPDILKTAHITPLHKSV